MIPMTTGPGARLAALAVTAAALTTPLAVPLAVPAHSYAAPAHDHPALEPGVSRGTVGIALADHPPAAGDDPRTHRYIVGHLDPGQTLTRRLRVTNDTDSAQRLQLYAGPATVGGGRFLPGEPGATNAVTKWTTVDPPAVQVPPGGSTLVTVTLTAPRDAPSQEHYGVIWASHTSAAPRGAGGRSAGLDLVSRVGVRVYLTAGEGRPAAPDFQIIDLRPIRDTLGAAALVATVVNVGGRAVDLAGTLELTEGPGGLTAPPVPAEPVTLAPGESAEVPFRLSPDTALPPGEWRATLDLASGSVRREATRTIGLQPHHVAPGAEPDGHEDRTMRIVVAAAVLAALVLVFGTWRAVIRRSP